MQLFCQPYPKQNQVKRRTSKSNKMMEEIRESPLSRTPPTIIPKSTQRNTSTRPNSAHITYTPNLGQGWHSILSLTLSRRLFRCKWFICLRNPKLHRPQRGTAPCLTKHILHPRLALRIHRDLSRARFRTCQSQRC